MATIPSSLQVPPDSTGQKLDVLLLLRADGITQVVRQVVAIGDPSETGALAKVEVVNDVARLHVVAGTSDQLLKQILDSLNRLNQNLESRR